MKRFFIILTVLVVSVNVQAQKMTHDDGNIEFLVGQNQIGVLFTYDENMKVGSLTEEEYIKKKMADADAKEPGSGKKWKATWYQDRTDYYQPRFIENFEKVLDKRGVVLLENGEASTYTMIVNTTFIERGYNVGISSKLASVNMTITFIETADPIKVLAKFTITKSYGDAVNDNGASVARCYGRSAKYLAKYLLDKKVF